jgi:hypothetical protein
MSMSGPIGIAKQRQTLLLLHSLQTSFTKEEFAQLIEDHPTFGVAASLTGIVRGLQIYPLWFVH